MPKRDAQHMQGQRERIVRAALMCIAEKGVARTSIDDIRRKAAMSSGALYVHFRNKEDILEETIRYSYAFERTLPRDWDGIVAAISLTTVRSDFDIDTIVRARVNLFGEAINAGGARSTYQQFIDATLIDFADRLRNLADRGEIRLRLDPLATAKGIAAFVNGTFLLAVIAGRDLEETRIEIAEGLKLFVA